MDESSNQPQRLMLKLDVSQVSLRIDLSNSVVHRRWCAKAVRGPPIIKDTSEVTNSCVSIWRVGCQDFVYEALKMIIVTVRMALLSDIAPA